MCFSSTASFTAAVVLGPLGLLAVRQARRSGQEGSLPLALTPLLFAVQQASEGVLWLRLENPALSAATDSGAGALTRAAALLFLFFAYGLWPAWMPWVALRFLDSRLEPWRRQVFKGLGLLGLLLGLGLWLPLAIDPDRLELLVVNGSIHYAPTLLASGVISHGLGTSLYALLVSLPLLLGPSPRLRVCGVLLLLAFALAQLAYLYAFTSVWCYFAALLSALVLWVVAEPVGSPLTPRPRTAGPPPR
ncbi:hypothetical protein [Vulcanococcus limneticus]|uniref:hypothetical protein n=1 Tax=Vulcanococcus limneticus TaxID=2170428 RepID=UPI00398BD11A